MINSIISNPSKALKKYKFELYTSLFNFFYFNKNSCRFTFSFNPEYHGMDVNLLTLLFCKLSK